jgi:hypothetical protein
MATRNKNAMPTKDRPSKPLRRRYVSPRILNSVVLEAVLLSCGVSARMDDPPCGFTS